MGAMKDLLTNHREAVSYVFWGGITTLISWGTYAVFVLLGIDANISNILSWVCGVVFAFFANKIYVFRSTSMERGLVLRELGMFMSSRIGTGILAAVLFPILVAIGLNQDFMGIEKMWARVVTSIVEIALNWVLSKYLVFRNGQQASE
ncbi:MAG: GtrA family protein [Thermoplasmata archaeon]|nr:GtrA family protein [Thermoplasmata archaeon]